MQENELKDLLKDFGNNVIFNQDLKKKIGLILEADQKFSIKQII